MRRIAQPTSVAIVALFATVASFTNFAASAAAAETTTYIISTPDATIAEGNQLVQEVGGQVEEQFKTLDTRIAQLTEQQAAVLDNIPGVIVSPDLVVHATATNTETPASWGLDRIDQTSMPLNRTYNYSNKDQGIGVKAYVIDTGVLTSHDEFTGRIASGYDAVGDGHGVVDCDGHGTHVAGTIAGDTVGVARQATIVPVRVLDCIGEGSLSDLLAGINWVIGNHSAGTPAVANLSLGLRAISTQIDNAVQAMIDDGITTVVAAGNEDSYSCGSSPGSSPNAITVAATAPNDSRAYYSNWGDCVDIFAPGGDYSSDSGVTSQIISAGISSNSSYAGMAGTSMASPHVAGAAARYLSVFPTATPAQVTDALISTSIKSKVTNPGLLSPNRLLYINPNGYGTAAALIGQDALGAPTAVSASITGFNQAAVTWNPPSATGGETITGYKINIFNDTVRLMTSTTVDGTLLTMVGMAAGQKYHVEIQALTATITSGGPVAKSATFIAYGQASEPRNLSAKRSSGKAMLAWKVPADIGKSKVLYYELNLTTDDSGTNWTGWQQVRSTSTKITGIPLNSTRIYKVRAVTAAGTGLEATLTFTIR